MDAWLGEAIAVGGTLGGALVGVGGGLAISRRERRDALAGRMRDAFSVYLGAVYPAVAELRELPDVPDVPGLTRIVDRLRGEAATFVTTRRRERLVFGDRPRELAQRVAIAVADLQVLPLPDQARAAVDAANDYLERLGERRTDAIKAEWPSIHHQLMRAAELLRDGAPGTRRQGADGAPSTREVIAGDLPGRQACLDRS